MATARGKIDLNGEKQVGFSLDINIVPKLASAGSVPALAKVRKGKLSKTMTNFKQGVIPSRIPARFSKTANKTREKKPAGLGATSPVSR